MQSKKPKSHKCSFSMLEREHLFPKKQKKYSSYYHICNGFTIFSVYNVVKIQRLKQFYRDKGCVEYYIRMAIQVLSFFDPSSVQFSRSVVSDSLSPHELQHARSPGPSPTPEVPTNSCPLSQWCHPTISSSVNPFSSYLQSFPVSGSFPMSWFFVSGGHTDEKAEG